ncbi:MAG: AbrB/MazE/SpoVT family DNA-binding domain-containing protein [Pseudomonadota bacterium]
MKYEAKITSKGQITLPAKLRQRLKAQSGDHLEFIETSDGEVVIRRKTESFEDLRGIVKLEKKVSLKDLEAYISAARSAIGTRS